MHRFASLISVTAILLAAVSAVAQESPSQQAPAANAGAPAVGTTKVRGCLRGDRGNYVLFEDKTNLVYVLKGVGNKLDRQRRHEVEVTGRVLPGTVKTGVRPEKSGSNPADTVHGVDGIPLQVANVESDVRTISNKCKAADQQ
jgi:hypothetical protein